MQSTYSDYFNLKISKLVPITALHTLEGQKTLPAKECYTVEELIYIKRFLTDTRMEEVWTQFAKIKNSKKTEIIWQFAGNAPFLPRQWHESQGPLYKEKMKKALTYLSRETDAYQRALMDCYHLLRKDTEIPFEVHKTLEWVKMLSDHYLSVGIPPKIGGQFGAASNFRENQNEGALKAYIWRWTGQFFNSAFGTPKYRHIGIVGEVICGTHEEFCENNIRNRVKQLIR